MTVITELPNELLDLIASSLPFLEERQALLTLSMLPEMKEYAKDRLKRCTKTLIISKKTSPFESSLQDVANTDPNFLSTFLKHLVFEYTDTNMFDQMSQIVSGANPLGKAHPLGQLESIILKDGIF